MFYKCDPRKNTTCRKTTCFINNGNCLLTSNPKYRIDGTKEIEGQVCGSPAGEQARIMEEIWKSQQKV